MSLTGKGSLSLRKQDVREQKSLATGFKKVTFAHKASLGDTGFNLSALTIPTEMSSLGFTNPSGAELLATQLYFYRKNFTLISSIRGCLMDYLSYDVPSSSRINFNGFTAEDGEVFIGIIDYNARNGVNLVDAAPLVSSGTLAVGVQDFNVGQLFEINKYSTQQVGAVIVYRNGVQQFRNTGNSSASLDANYYEVNNGSGTGQIIRFNNAPVGDADSILVVSNGMLAYNPDGSALQKIETLAGQIDAMIPTLADLAGVPTTNFRTAPNNADLKSFGDKVLAILSTPIPIQTTWATFTPVFNNGPTFTVNDTFKWRRDGEHIELEGSFNATGSGAASQFSLQLPPVLIGSITMPSTYAAGFGTTYALSGDVGFTVSGIAVNSGSVFTVFDNDTGSFLIGSNITSGDIISFKIRTKVNEWNATQTIAQALGL